MGRRHLSTSLIVGFEQQGRTDQQFLYQRNWERVGRKGGQKERWKVKLKE